MYDEGAHVIPTFCNRYAFHHSLAPSCLPHDPRSFLQPRQGGSWAMTVSSPCKGVPFPDALRFPRTGFHSRLPLTSPLLIDTLADMRNYIPSFPAWGVASQECFHSLGLAFYRGADSCAMVCDNSAWTWSGGMGCGRRWKQAFIQIWSRGRPRNTARIGIKTTVCTSSLATTPCRRGGSLQRHGHGQRTLLP